MLFLWLLSVGVVIFLIEFIMIQPIMKLIDLILWLKKHL